MLCIYYNKSFTTNEKHLENHNRITIPIQHFKTKFHDKIPIYSSTAIYNYTKSSNNLTNEEVESLAIDYLKNTCNENYIGHIKKICSSLRNGDIIDGDTYFTKLTYEEIIDSALIVRNACNKLVDNSLKYAYVLIRPPSHHSSLNYYSGFCIVNQTYQAAKYLADNFNKTVFILDYDVHHGDGTQKLVKENYKNDIFFCSIHCYENGFYPGTGNILENSKKNLNIPLPRNQTDATYIEKFNNEIIPFITDVRPDIVIISNGLDAHIDEPMSVMKLTNIFYEYVTKYLKSLNVPLLYILEGGYNPNVISVISEKIIKLLT